MTARSFSALRERAAALDAKDALAKFRNEFHIPQCSDGREKIYFCGNSLGLQPKRLAAEMEAELSHWAKHGVDGHFEGKYPWMPYHENLTQPLADLVGALPTEVVAMNSLTANLHLMMVSFYRPTKQRYKILIEKHAFPSDRYACHSQIRFHGYDPQDALIELEDEPGSATLSVDTLAQYLDKHGKEVALVLMPGVQYYSGQLQDLKSIAEIARRKGCRVGFDLAHAAGNIPLQLHDWAPDFAVWCSYKYLNSGPGAVAGCFVHEAHQDDPALPRFAGWWGHEQESRFKMGPEFVPAKGAEGWQLSNPPIMALAPVRVSLEVFAEAGGMQPLREKSVELTNFLENTLLHLFPESVHILTPPEPEHRGCQLSLEVAGGKDIFDKLTNAGVVCDWREPNVIRIAPTPLYNRYLDVVDFAQALAGALEN